MFVHYAESWEADLLREVFGPQVRDVTFYDAEEGDGRFVFAIGHDERGKEIGDIGPDDPAWSGPVADTGLGLNEIPGTRGETVKFGLQIDDEED